MKKNDIFLIYGTDYKKMTREILEAADLAGMIGDRDARIGCKRNLVLAKPPESGATTHAELLDGTIEYLHAHGFHNIRIMEGSWVGGDTERAFRAAGYDRIAGQYRIPLINLQKDSAREYDAAGMKIRLCDAAASVDFMINMPVLKGHCQTRITCALKNNKGVIPNSEKRRFHTLGLHKPIAHLNTIERNDFILVDNICGDLDFEEGGSPVPMDRILAFADPVLCDAFVCDTMGYAVEDVPYISMAEKLGVGSADLSSASVHMLNHPGEVRTITPSGKVARLARYVTASDACSACYGALIHALNQLDEEGFLDRSLQKTPVAVGQGFRSASGPIGVGNCTRRFACSQPGCPPSTNEILSFLKEHWKGRS